MFYRLRLISMKRILFASILPLLAAAYLIVEFTCPALKLIRGPEDYKMVAKDNMQGAYVDLATEGSLLYLNTSYQEENGKTFRYFLFYSEQNDSNLVIKMTDDTYMEHIAEVQEARSGVFQHYDSETAIHFKGGITKMNDGLKTELNGILSENEAFLQSQNTSLPVYVLFVSDEPFGNNGGVIFWSTVGILLIAVSALFLVLAFSGFYLRKMKKQLDIKQWPSDWVKQDYKKGTHFQGDVVIGKDITFFFRGFTPMLVANSEIRMITFEESKKQKNKDVTKYDVLLCDQDNRSYRLHSRECVDIYNYYEKHYPRIKIESVHGERESFA
ncbi:MAG: hypothetical protein E7256_16110 [Lachnospiraceae bacterium]|nr:hypothetical protein [Lachnospiraceae bacterium]